ncbi:MAG: hypothetical protein ACI8U4_002825 [Natronomonas sp.]|jgi:hypothetical protein
MADSSRGLFVHNEGPSTTSVHIVVHAADVSPETVTLAPGETHTLAESIEAAVEVHTTDGMATAFGGNAPIFIVRDGSVIVTPN